jgi:hypothetical protein
LYANLVHFYGVKFLIFVVLLQDLNLDFWFLFLPALSAAEFSISVQAQPFCFWSSTCCWLFGQGATTGPSPVFVAGPLSSFQFSFRSQVLLPAVHLAQDFLTGLLFLLMVSPFFSAGFGFSSWAGLGTGRSHLGPAFSL